VFGLKRLLFYIENSNDIPSDVIEKIKEIIRETLAEYYRSYNDTSIDDSDLPSLDIRAVFSDYIERFEKNEYIREKLFTNIAPAFHKKEGNEVTDIDYLLKFICAANQKLGIELNLETSVHGVICQYFVKSVEKNLQESR
ncbi:MAG: hypothetical protein ACRC17_03470, partial [Culicoidibacterales bacterium]